MWTKFNQQGIPYAMGGIIGAPFQKIYDITTVGGEASIDITGIPTNYAHLLIIWFARGTSATANLAHQVRFNNDSGSNYDWVETNVIGTSAPASGQSGAQTAARIGTFAGASTYAGAYGNGAAFIPHYLSTTGRKKAVWIQANATGATESTINATDGPEFRAGTLNWRSSAAINRITLFPSSANFAVDSRITLYGLGVANSIASATTTFGATPPTSPATGDYWEYPADANGVVWRFRYNGGSASSFKWEFVGGPPLFAEVLTNQGTTTNTYTNLATTGPSVSIPRAGDFDVEFGDTAYQTSGATGSVYFSSVDFGSGASDTDAIERQPTATVDFEVATRWLRKTGLSAGTATAKYKGSDGVKGYEWRDRWIKVTPVRVS